MLLTQRPHVLISAFPKIYFDVAEIYEQHWLEESGLENVNRTHLVLASVKRILARLKSYQLKACIITGYP